MVKIKLLNHHKGRNEHLFDNLSTLYSYFLEQGIELYLDSSLENIFVPVFINLDDMKTSNT